MRRLLEDKNSPLCGHSEILQKAPKEESLFFIAAGFPQILRVHRFFAGAAYP